LILGQLAELKAGTDALKAGNEALQESLTRQEARYREELAALRKEFETRLTAYKTFPPELIKEVIKEEPVPTTVMSGSGSPPVDAFCKSDRLPDPPIFSGKRKDLPTFIRKLKYKLEGNADRYFSERARLLYAHSRLERDPVTLIDPLIDKDICTVN